MKKYRLSAALIIMLAMLTRLCTGTLAFEAPLDNDDDRILGSYGFENAVSAAVQTPDFALDAASLLLLESSTGTVLYEKNADAKRPIASITKIMTLILTMEALERGEITLEDGVETSVHAYSMGGSQIWLEPGEIMTVDELLRAVCVASANDAAVALAEHIDGSETSFVASMNRRAAELGMTNTTFKNASGLDEDGHLSTARDVSLMSRELLRHELIRNYVTIWMDELRGGETELVNTNKMLKSYNGITGLKTGTTSKAGVCISASAKRDDMELFAVVLGSSDSAGRFKAAQTLLDFGFANYELAPVSLEREQLSMVRVRLGTEQYCAVHFEMPSGFVVEKGKKDSIVSSVEMSELVEAPVEQGQVVGEIKIFSDAQLIGTYEIKAQNTVEKLNLKRALELLIAALFASENEQGAFAALTGDGS